MEKILRLYFYEYFYSQLSSNPEVAFDVRFSNRPFRVKHFQTIHHGDVDVARGLVLLFGIGTAAQATALSMRWFAIAGPAAQRDAKNGILAKPSRVF